MKVYIVTAGSYSDYRIEKVFIDKEKAEKYIALCQDNWDYPQIEEFETDDDKLIDKITYIKASYSKGRSSYRKNEVEVEIKVTNTLDNSEEDMNRNSFYFYSWSGDKDLTILRVLKGEYDEERLKSKYAKVTYDLMAKIESLLDIEGWDDKMVKEWLDQNTDEFLK
jgi:hypothetical protein